MLCSGRTGSCGCSKDRYKKITGKNSVQFTGHEEIRGRRWSHIKSHARTRGLEFSVTIKYAWKLYEKQNRKCALSGLPIEFDKNGGNTSASLDRINSSLGYIEGNVQWTHKLVNKMKWDFSQQEFLNFCRLVAERKVA